MDVYGKQSQRQEEIMRENPGMHPHRAQYLAEQELTPAERDELRTIRLVQMHAWLDQEAKRPRSRAPQHMIDIHIRNGWDID